MEQSRSYALLAALIVASLLAVGALAAAEPAGTAVGGGDAVEIYFFYGEGCPYCALEEAFLAELVVEHPEVEVRAFEVYSDLANRELLFSMAAAYGGEVTGVPVTFIGEYAWTGFGDRTRGEMLAVVEHYLALREPAGGAGQVGSEEQAVNHVIELPLYGEVDLGSRSLWVATGLLALVDGFNPCSLWVMALLLGVVINTRSRRRVLLVGSSFLVVAAGAYALFIAGLFSAFALFAFARWLRIAVAGVALAYAAVGIKDYFAFGRGLSFTISDDHKPGIYRRVRGVMASKASLPATLLATGGMALGVTLIELPCTAGLPVLWTQLVGAAGVPPTTFALLLALYMLIFLLDELVVFSLAVLTMRATRVREREARVLKLVGGCVMLALAAALLWWPQALADVKGTLLVFGAGAGAALLTAALHRLVAPASSPLTPA